MCPSSSIDNNSARHSVRSGYLFARLFLCRHLFSNEYVYPSFLCVAFLFLTQFPIILAQSTVLTCYGWFVVTQVGRKRRLLFRPSVHLEKLSILSAPTRLSVHQRVLDVRDAALELLLSKVIFETPDVEEDWFYILVLHQNRFIMERVEKDYFYVRSLICAQKIKLYRIPK